MKKQTLVLACTALLGGCLCSGLKQQEMTYKSRIEELDKLELRADGDLKREIADRKAAFEAEYARLPLDESRGDGLGRVCQESRAYIEEATKKVEAQEKAKADAEAARIAEYRKDFIGEWKGVGMDLTITSDGSVAYKRVKGGGTSAVNGPIKEFTKMEFKVSVLGIGSTFKIDKPPVQAADGAWKMTIDGCELTKAR